MKARVMPARLTRLGTLAAQENAGLNKTAELETISKDGGKKVLAKRKAAEVGKGDDNALDEATSAKKTKKQKTNAAYLDPFEQSTIPEPSLSVSQHEAHSRNLSNSPPTLSCNGSSPISPDERSPFQRSLDQSVPEPDETTIAPTQTELPLLKPVSKLARKPLTLPPLPSIKSSKPFRASTVVPMSPRQPSLAPPHPSAAAMTPSYLPPPSMPFASSTTVSRHQPQPVSFTDVPKQSAPATKTSKHVTDLVATLLSCVDWLEGDVKGFKESEQYMRSQQTDLLAQNHELTK
ncbi:hypothetical protein HWV62_21656 [Athelia sp. TMB]|nr:hypothetical protein HWV62_21656 [Athelia sp. TMB]